MALSLASLIDSCWPAGARHWRLGSARTGWAGSGWLTLARWLGLAGLAGLGWHQRIGWRAGTMGWASQLADWVADWLVMTAAVRGARALDAEGAGTWSAFTPL